MSLGNIASYRVGWRRGGGTRKGGRVQPETKGLRESQPMRLTGGRARADGVSCIRKWRNPRCYHWLVSRRTICH